MNAKLKRLGAKGDYKCGGKAYAAGGRVKGYAFGGSPMGADTDMDGSGPSGGMPKPNLGKPGMKGKSKGKGKGAGKGKTNVNIINLGSGADKGGPGGPPMPLGGPPMPPGGGGPPMPMAKPPMPPMGGPGPIGGPGGPGPGGPPLLRKSGGRIGRKFGGSIKMAGQNSPVKGKTKGC